MDEIYKAYEVAEIIGTEGLEYTLLEYLNLNQIEDGELRELCITAKTAIENVHKFLAPYYEEE